MSDLMLYSYFRSSTSYRVRIALNWKNLTYQYQAVHLLKDGGEQHLPTYKALNPMGAVPTLIHQGHIISQSMAIIEYLEEVFPSPPLLPKDPYTRAKIRQICENINCDIHPLQNLKVLKKLNFDFGANEEQKMKWASHWILQGLSSTEKLLEHTAGLYSFGNEITLADLFLIPQIFNAQRYQVDINSLPIISRIYKACEVLPAFAKAHPFRQPDTPADLRSST